MKPTFTETIGSVNAYLYFVKTKATTATSINGLNYLPSYAQYLLTHRIDELTTLQLSLAEELELPLMKFLRPLPSDERFRVSKESTIEFLSYLAENRAQEQIDDSLRKWRDNTLPVISRDDIVAEDITQVTYLRKRSLLHFIPEFTSDLGEALDIVRETDLFLSASETAATNTFIQFLQQKITEDTLLIEKVNHTVPGAIYIFDLETYRNIFSNQKLAEIIGYTTAELNQLGENALKQLVHPDDQRELRQRLDSLRTAKDGDVLLYKYRILNKSGQYKWLSNHETVFKRNEKGEVIQTIGITLDIDKEEQTSGRLKLSEERYKQAEAITHIGNYVWDLETNLLTWSDELFRIYGLTPVENLQYEAIREFNHPEDNAIVQQQVQDAIKNRGSFDFYYRIVLKDGTQKILHARGATLRDGEGKTVKMIGTAQDVTEKQSLIQRLKHNESVHKQAEELANLGSWTWDLSSNRIEWSDQMYQIYGLKPQSLEISVDVFKGMIHPDDVKKIEGLLKNIFIEKYSDHFFRIVTPDGKIKKLHTIARVFTDSNGNPAYIVGAEQDITEKEQLLETLKKSEAIYKQSEELANMGNWNWDVKNNRLSWTDHLYRIYGLEPQSEEITIERFLSFVHPDDRSRVSQGVEDISNKDRLDYTFRIVTGDGRTKILRSVAQVQRNASGEPEMVVGSERDITEKQSLIEKLQRSEKLYKQAQSLAHVGNWSWHIPSDTIEWSDELCRIYGMEPGQKLTYEQYLSHIHPEDKEKVTSQVRHAMDTGKTWEYSHKLLRTNGELRIVHATGEVLVDEKGKPYMMIGTAQDVTERQMLIDRLQESEKLFKQAQSLAQLGNWTLDVKTKEFTWSDEMYNIYELDRNEPFNFEKWLLHLDPADRDRIIAYYEDCLANKKLYDQVHNIHLRNGKTKIIHRKGEFIYDEAGQPVKMVGTTQDITEDYRIQQELEENQTFIRKIADATPSIIASYNINSGKYVFISEGLEKLLGHDPKEVMEKGVAFFADIMHPDDIGPIMEKNAKALEEANTSADKNDLVVEFTYRMRHRDGGYRWFHTYGTVFDRNAEGQVEHVLNISLDVTEQVEASQKIKEQEHFIQQIADASPTILYLYDVSSQSIAYINREIFFVLGYLPDEVIAAGEQITDLLYHPEDLPLLPGRKQSQKTFQQVDSMIQYECRMKNKEGEWRWVLVREIVFKADENGNIVQILGAALDINRRKDMEKTILQNTLLLEQSNASLEEFAYVASHDLKEPLRKISTFGDRLVNTQMEKLAPEGKIYLQKIVDASQRMQTMISDLLSISMITGNTSFENYSLQKILEETLQTLEFKIEQQNALIKADPLPETKMIPSQFRQLFQNLLSNSLKFVKPGVRPELTIKHSYLSAQDIVHYQLAVADRYQKLEFSDNGIGFENEYAGKIFAIFQRLHGRSEYEGSGIGLAICKKIVEHHGGIIYATGVPEEGANFTVILPA